LAGSFKLNMSGGIMVHNASLPDLQTRMNNDPSVAENSVRAEIIEITPSKTDDRLKFLLGVL